MLSSGDYLFNQNLDGYLSSLSPASNKYFSNDNDENDFSNITFKLRGSYDLTPANSVYAMVSSGFLPGDVQVSPLVAIANAFDRPPTPVTVSFTVLPYDQEKLTSFEVGSKNRFLDDRLQRNGAVFCYSYSGYQEAVNIAPSGSPIPEFVVVTVPVRMVGCGTGRELAADQRRSPQPHRGCNRCAGRELPNLGRRAM